MNRGVKNSGVFTAISLLFAVTCLAVCSSFSQTIPDGTSGDSGASQDNLTTSF